MLKIELEIRRPNHAYEILLEPGLGADWRREVEERMISGSYLALVDANLARQWNSPADGGKWRCLWVEPGEENKTLTQYQSLCEAALDMGLDRNTVVVAVGGGVTGDIAGFLAATLFRGVRLVQIPTSLLAQVDSSVGGKNGVNCAAGKNMIGTFHQPDLVLIDPGFLDTLPRREYLAGLAEVVKTAVLDSSAFFHELQMAAEAMLSLNHGMLSGVIARCCRIKTRFVIDDEFDKGRRALLNLGHTFGHVLESFGGYDGRVVHGEAVAVGMVLACRFSMERGILSEHDANEVRDLLAALRLPVAISQLGRISPNPPDWQALFAAGDVEKILLADKKADGGRINLVLPHAIGDCRVEKGFRASEVAEFMRQALGMISNDGEAHG